jgi:hypothetical protein
VSRCSSLGSFCLSALLFFATGLPVLAQLSPGLGAETADVAAVGALTGKRAKGELLITDSLWGNLILDLAYQRDSQLKKYAKRMNLVNLGTTATVTGIAGGTLAQGVIALSVLNPPDPKSDSYLPGGIGVGFAGLTLVAFGARTAAAYVLAQKLRNRQLAIKHQVESILKRIEDSHGENSEAQTALISLIGERATNEWLQLWRSSNMIATETKPQHVSVKPRVRASDVLTADVLPAHQI